MISWTDQRGLEAVEARYGARAARYIPAHGPIVLAHMLGMDGPFNATNIVRALLQNEYPTFTEPHCHDIVMQVIRYINHSSADYYIQQRRVRKAYLWSVFNPGAGKSQLREQDEAFANKSRVRVVRQYNAPTRASHPQSEPIVRPATNQHTIAARVANMTPAHLSLLKSAFQKYFDGMKMPIDAVKPDRMANIYYSPGFAQFMTVDDRDAMTDFNEEQLIESFSLVADMLAADERGMIARPGDKLDLL